MGSFLEREKLVVDIFEFWDWCYSVYFYFVDLKDGVR